jgi:H+/Cl- antiporter ClcA
MVQASRLCSEPGAVAAHKGCGRSSARFAGADQYARINMAEPLWAAKAARTRQAGGAPGMPGDRAMTTTPRKPTAHHRRRRRFWLASHIWRRRLVFWLGALAAGYAAVGFAIAANGAQALFGRAISSSPLLALAITPAALALSAFLARRFFPGSQGSGIPQAIAARDPRDPERRNRLLSLRVAAGKIGLCLIGLLGGASIGREGPTVQVGAAIILFAGKISGMGREPGLILAGSAAGVAAAFNAPLAGVVFAIEEMSRAFEHKVSSLVLIAVILAGLAAQTVLGNHTYFGATAATLVSAKSWIVVMATGAIGGLAGGGFSRLVIVITRHMPRAFGGAISRRPILFAAAAGLILACIGLASGGATYGTGYDQARQALQGAERLSWTFAPLKLLATLVSSVSGIPGGLFSPSISVGAGIGSALSALFPTTPAGAIVLLGMVGYFAGVVQAPITGFVIVTEMTDDQAMLIPLMATSVIAYGMSKLVCPEALYHALAQQYLAPPAGPVQEAGVAPENHATVRAP